MTIETSDLYAAMEHLVSHKTTREELAAGIPIIERGSGCTVWDTTGKEYLDLCAGVTRPVAVGYGRTELAHTMARRRRSSPTSPPCPTATRRPSSWRRSWPSCFPAT